MFVLISACGTKPTQMDGRRSDPPGGGDAGANPKEPFESPEPMQTPEPEPLQTPDHPTPSGTAKMDLVGLKVTLDVGHAYKGGDRSAQSRGINEHTKVRAQAAIIEKKLKARGASVTIKTYEYADADTSTLAARGKAGAGSTVLVSLHHNAYDTDVQGTETLIDTRRGMVEADKRFAKFIQDAMLAALWKGNLKQYGGRLDRGVKDQELRVMVSTPKSVAACCTTEPYFITGKGAAENAEAWTVASAHAIADGIAQWWKFKSGAMSLYSQYEPPLSFDLTPSDPIDAEVYRDH